MACRKGDICLAGHVIAHDPLFIMVAGARLLEVIDDIATH